MKSLYNSYSNTLYASSYNEVTSYAIPSLTTISEYKNGKGNGTPIAAALNSDKIAVDYSDEICIFSGKELKLIATINYPEVAYAPKDILFTIQITDNLRRIYFCRKPISQKNTLRQPGIIR